MCALLILRIYTVIFTMVERQSWLLALSVILLDKQTGWGWMTAQLGDLTCSQASNDPWSSSLVNTGDRSQVELLGVLELLKTNELGGRKLSPAVFCLIWLLLFLKCFELEVCMKMNPDITQHNSTPQKTKPPKPDLWCFCSSVPISRGSVRPSSTPFVLSLSHSVEIWADGSSSLI